MDVPLKHQLITTHAVKTQDGWTELNDCACQRHVVLIYRYVFWNVNKHKVDDNVELSALNLAWSDISQGPQIIKI